MINIGICDDEAAVLQHIKRLAAEFFYVKNVKVNIFLFTSGEELLNCNQDMNIVFLDIQMRPIDGMETAKKLRAKKFNGFIIFITILKEMVFQSFEVEAFDYLLKPIEKKNFEKTMNRLLCAMKSAARANLLVQCKTESIIVSFDEIIFCEIIDRKIYLYLKSESGKKCAQPISYYEKIENLEKKLDSRFFRCHRSYLINMQYLLSYENCTAYMTENYQIPVSRLRSKDFAARVLQYMKEWRL